MLSLRLPLAHESLVNQAATRAGLSRSAWLRGLIDAALAAQSRPDPHALHQQLMAAVGPGCGSGAGNLGRDHSQVLKNKLKSRANKSRSDATRAGI